MWPLAPNCEHRRCFTSSSFASTSFSAAGRNGWAGQGRAGQGRSGHPHLPGLTFLKQLLLAAVQGADLQGQPLWFLMDNKGDLSTTPGFLPRASEKPIWIWSLLICLTSCMPGTVQLQGLCIGHSLCLELFYPRYLWW